MTTAAAFKPLSHDYIIHAHLLLWRKWETARDYAKCRSVLFRRTQQIRSYTINGQVYWHVRSTPGGERL